VSGEGGKTFKRYESPSHERKLQMTRMLPHLTLKVPDKLAETVNANTGEIIKPWETRRDLFHETFKRYIADSKGRPCQWPCP
jgi:hypothetical protein